MARRRGATLLLVLLVLNAWPASAEPQERITAAATDARRRFDEWFGPTGLEPFTLDAKSRWWSSERDVSLERRIIISVARQFWSAIASADAAFREGLSRYTAARVINDTLDGRHLTTYRFFGGFVPYTVRSVALSRAQRDPRPLVRRFPEFVDDDRAASTSWVPKPDAADRWAEALHTLERSLGWPAMQQALSELARRHSSGNATPASFATIVGEQRGSDVVWFDAAAASSMADIDYAIEGFTSVTDSATSSYETVIRLRREGMALFPLPVLTEFADGTQQSDVFEAIDGRADLRYHSAAPAVRVSIDPDVVLLLDTDRTNNVVSLRPRSLPPAGARLLWNWLIWLQDLLLTCAALV